MKDTHYFLLAILFLFFFNANNGISAQNTNSKKNKLQQFIMLSMPEKCWVIFHPFIAKKAWEITKTAQSTSKALMQDTVLNADPNGGQIDAFRHAFWMALLSQQIKKKKALALGIAHEKGNYKDFLKNRLEDGSVPDKKASEMDIWNNKAGADIGALNKNLSNDQIQSIVIDSILMGRMKILKKDGSGNYLCKDNKIITKERIKGQWETPKVLVPSNSPYQIDTKKGNLQR